VGHLCPPGSGSEYGSGSTSPTEYGSNPGPDPKPWFYRWKAGRTIRPLWCLLAKKSHIRPYRLPEVITIVNTGFSNYVKNLDAHRRKFYKVRIGFKEKKFASVKYFSRFFCKKRAIPQLPKFLKLMYLFSKRNSDNSSLKRESDVLKKRQKPRKNTINANKKTQGHRWLRFSLWAPAVAES